MSVNDLVATLIVIIGTVGVILTLQRVINSFWRQFTLLAALLVLDLLAVVPFAASIVSLGNWLLPKANQMYWYVALASEVTTVLFVVQMVHRVAGQLPNTGAVLRAITAGSMLLALASFAIHSGPKVNLMFTFVIRDLSFLAAVGNLVLWNYLLRLRNRDGVLLAVCAGLGIHCTGDAIGHSVRTLAPALRPAAELFMSVSSLVTIFIWYRAFRPTRAARVNRAMERNVNAEDGPDHVSLSSTL